MTGITALIPTWNRAGYLETALSCLAAQSRTPERIIVVDNGSSDETPEVAARFGVELIRFEENRGFAPAVNAGVRAADTEWVLILNNDVDLPVDWLQRLLSAAEAGNAAFAAGKLVCHDNPGILDGSWDLLSRGGHAWRCGFGRADGPAWAERRSIDFAPMTAALFRKRLFDEAGYLDERFEAYYEDVDFGLRCAAAGFRGVYEPSAVARHRSKGTLGNNSRRVLFLTARNQLFLLAKNYPGRILRRWFWAVFIGQTLSLAGAAQSGHLWSALQGVWEGLRRWDEMRGSGEARGAVEEVLLRSEREIYELQRSLGFDPYWRLYFSLVRSG